MRSAARSLGVVILALAPTSLLAQQGGGGFPATAPPPLESHPVRFPSVGRQTLPNGLDLVVVENHEQPVVSVRLYLPAGGVSDPSGEVGLATMTASLLDKGTTSRSAEQIASTVEGVGASLNTGANDDIAYVASTTLTRDLPTVLGVFSDIVLHPTFPEGQVETMRKRQLSALRIQLSEPGVLAAREFSREIYGDNPYANAPTEASLKKIDRAALRSFHADHYVPGGSLLVFAGDIDMKAARAAAEKWFGDWKGSGPAAASEPSPAAPKPTHITLIDRPGSVQSNVWVGNLGIRPGDPDAVPLDVMNRVLGGGANSRLFLILRERKGWTYGAYSRLTTPEGPGYFAATAEVRTPVTDSALSEMMHQLERIRAQRVPKSELDAAKAYLTGHFPIELETPSQVASRVADVILRGVGIGYLEHYRSRVEAVTPAEVERVARTHIHPDSSVVVVVGDGSKIYDDLKAIAPVSIQDVSGHPVDPAALKVKYSKGKLDMTGVRQGTFTYRLVVQGKAYGTYTLSLAKGKAPGTWDMAEKVQGAMGSQTNTYTFHGDLTPISAKETGAASKDLTYTAGHVKGSATALSDSGKARKVEVDRNLPEGTLEPGTSVAIILAAPLRAGIGFQVPVFVPGKGVGSMTARVTGQDTVKVPAGSYPVYKVEASGQSGLRILFDVTRSAPHMLVKQEFEGRPVAFELTKAGG